MSIDILFCFQKHHVTLWIWSWTSNEIYQTYTLVGRGREEGWLSWPFQNNVCALLFTQKNFYNNIQLIYLFIWDLFKLFWYSNELQRLWITWFYLMVKPCSLSYIIIKNLPKPQAQNVAPNYGLPMATTRGWKEAWLDTYHGLGHLVGELFIPHTNFCECKKGVLFEALAYIVYNTFE